MSSTNTIFIASTSITFIKIHIFPLGGNDIRGFTYRENAGWAREAGERCALNAHFVRIHRGWRRFASAARAIKRGTLKNALRLSLSTTKGNGISTLLSFSHSSLSFARLPYRSFLFHLPRHCDWIDRRGEMHTCDRALHENVRIMEIITRRAVQMGTKAFFFGGREYP